MRRRRRLGPALLTALVIVVAEEASRRVLAEAIASAPERLEETGLYEPGRPGVVAAANRPYSPQYPLWTDGAAKARWIYLPPGTTIDATNAAAWEFPVGTRLWKEFAFNGRKVETRFLWKASPQRWVFATYVWNEDGTDAVRAPDEGILNAAAIGNGRMHTVPGLADCRACHDARRTEILGFNALQLSPDRDPNAIHGERVMPGMVTLDRLVAERRIETGGVDLLAAPPRIQAKSPRARAVLGYLVGNCGGCHNADGELGKLGPSLKHADVAQQGEALVARLLTQRTTWQVPGLPEGTSRLIDSHTPAASAILARMRSRRPSTQMPPLGSAVPDREALAVIEAWIAEELPRD